MVHISHIIKWSQDSDEEDNLCFYILCRTQKDDSIASLQQKQTNKQTNKKQNNKKHKTNTCNNCQQTFFARQNKLAGLVVHVIIFLGFFQRIYIYWCRFCQMNLIKFFIFHLALESIDVHFKGLTHVTRIDNKNGGFRVIVKTPRCIYIYKNQG